MKIVKKLVGCLMMCLFIVAGMLIAKDSNEKNTTVESENETFVTQEEANEQQETTEINPEILYQANEIEIYSLFSSNVINIDADSEFTNDLASIEFKNISGRFLKKCEINILASNGETYSFIANDIPPEMEVMAFDTNSKTLKANAKIEKMDYFIEEDSSDVLLSKKLEVLEQGLEITVKNISDEDFLNLIVTCHCMMDEISYGGSIYEYPIKMLKSGESTTFEAVDCVFGQAKVVRISVKDKE